MRAFRRLFDSHLPEAAKLHLRNRAVPLVLRIMRGQRGGLLVETVVAIMVFTAVGSAVLTGLSISQTTGGDIERRAVAEELARTQMEYLASQPYQDPPVVYGIAPTVVLPPGYAMLIVGAEEYPGDQNLQRITVTVSAGAENVLTLETFRTRVN